MKTFVIAVILVLLSSPVLSHPGKTDRRGGHKCRKGCAEWGLVYKEYHLHDEYFRPVRPAEAKTAAVPAITEAPSSDIAEPDVVEKKMPAEESENNEGREDAPTAQAAYQTNVPVKSDIWVVDPLFLLSAALLLILLLVLSRTRGNRNKEI